MMGFDYVSLLERARQNRDRYETDSIANAQAADQRGYSNPNMFSNESRTRWNNSMARNSMAPSWDAWFQAAEEGGWQAPQSRVRPGRLESRHIGKDPHSSFNKNPHMRSSLKALETL